MFKDHGLHSYANYFIFIHLPSEIWKEASPEVTMLEHPTKFKVEGFVGTVD